MVTRSNSHMKWGIICGAQVNRDVFGHSLPHDFDTPNCAVKIWMATCKHVQAVLATNSRELGLQLGNILNMFFQ